MDLEKFKAHIDIIRNADKATKIKEIKALLDFPGFFNHYQNKNTHKTIIASYDNFEYQHEFHTAKKLTGENYYVIFLPVSYFKRNEKRFDVFLCREHIFLEADLKRITSTNPDTIGKRIREGSQQAARLVLDIHSTINKKLLIEALKTGCEKNDDLKQLLIFYESKFYCLNKTQVLSKAIFMLIK